jgi:hypothetical protein
MFASGILVGAGFTGVAWAEQTHMVNARDHLNMAWNQLNMAEPDKGGHRGNAMNLVKQAIGEVNAGIAYAASH